MKPAYIPNEAGIYRMKPAYIPIYQTKSAYIR